MINDRAEQLMAELQAMKERRLRETLLSLHGWVPVENRTGALRSWGISHTVHGTIKEDAWNRKHGPTTADLKIFPMPEHIHQPEHECRWDALGSLSLKRLYDCAVANYGVED